MSETTRKTAWRQVGGWRFEAEAPAGRHVWVGDGTLGFARPLAGGETAAQAVADFESAGVPAAEVRVYEDGQRVE